MEPTDMRGREEICDVCDKLRQREIVAANDGREPSPAVRLRSGYTTGSCAAAAAQAAVRMLFSQEDVPVVKLVTPKGVILYLEPVEAGFDMDEAYCAIQKDAGDDPDVTDGILVYAHVRKCSREDAVHMVEKQSAGSTDRTAKKGAWQEISKKKQTEMSALFPAEIIILGGEGVGTVTQPGLEQPVGAPAINRVPRSMILHEAQSVCEEYGYTEGLEITISAPAGVGIAKKTFNPRLGIEGGISILGTSGIVEPMSEQAIIETIRLELHQKALTHKYLIITPGNYGTQYLNDNFPFDAGLAVKCSNYVGQTIDMAVNEGLSGILFVAHIGKFVKVAGGIMNTHSKEADSRMEILSSCAIRAGIEAGQAREILACVTTDEGLRVIREAGVWDETMRILMDKIYFYLKKRAQGLIKIGAVIFSNVYGELGRTRDVSELIGDLCTEYFGNEPQKNA